MTCQEFTDFIMAYRDDELSPEVRLAFDSHLAECPACRQYLQSYDEAVALAKQAGHQDAPAPGEVPEELLRAILQARKTRRD